MENNVYFQTNEQRHSCEVERNGEMNMIGKKMT